MNPTLRFLISIPLGVILGILVINSLMPFSPYQPPPGVDIYQSSKMIAWANTLPPQAFFIQMAVFFTACFCGGFLTNWLAKPAGFRPALFTGFLLIIYCIVLYLAFPNPEWMTFGACTGCMLSAGLGGYVARKVIK